jgi:hypothetical protein
VASYLYCHGQDMTSSVNRMGKYANVLDFRFAIKRCGTHCTAMASLHCICTRTLFCVMTLVLFPALAVLIICRCGIFLEGTAS